MINCCHNCENRDMRCHITCRTYNTALKKHNAEQLKIREEKEKNKDSRLRAFLGMKASIERKKY